MPCSKSKPVVYLYSNHARCTLLSFLLSSLLTSISSRWNPLPNRFMYKLSSAVYLNGPTSSTALLRTSKSARQYFFKQTNTSALNHRLKVAVPGLNTHCRKSRDFHVLISNVGRIGYFSLIIIILGSINRCHFIFLGKSWEFCSKG